MIVEQELYGHDLPWDVKWIALGIPRSQGDKDSKERTAERMSVVGVTKTHRMETIVA